MAAIVYGDNPLVVKVRQAPSGKDFRAPSRGTSNVNSTPTGSSRSKCPRRRPPVWHGAACGALALCALAATAQTPPIESGIRTWDADMPLSENERPAREYLDLSGEWRFRADPQGVGDPEQWFAESVPDADRSAWAPFRVPGVWNEGQDVGVPENYNGVGWFRRAFDLPDGWQGSTLRLKFLAVYLIADVWLNGQYLGKHRGGYTSFEFSVGAVVRGVGNVVVVRADNTPRPGQAPHHTIDWCNCGGISRAVYLVRVHAPILEPLVVRTRVSPHRAIVSLRFTGGTPTWIQGTLFDAPMRAASAFQLDPSTLTLYKALILDLEITIDAPDANVWSPERPALYYLRIAWKGAEDVWNVQWERFGFREVAVRDGQLLLNGAPIWLQGIAFHMDYPGTGSAGTRAQQRDDLIAAKRLNANFVRLGHYPYHRDTLDMCDELGLLVWSEIPVWQNSPEDLGDAAFNRNWAFSQLNEMVDQLRNHTSIIVWSVGNEFSRAWLSRGEREDPRTIDYVRRSTGFLRQKDPTRLVSYASAASTGVGTWEFLDVVGKPLHYGWFHSANVYDIRREVDLVHAAVPDKPILAVELTGMSYPDRHAPYGADERHSLEYHDKLLRVDLQSLMARRAFVAGVTVWTLRDLKGGREVGTYGLFTRDGRVKYLYETVKNLYRPEPRLLLHEDATRFRSGEMLTVRLETFSTGEALEEARVEWQVWSGAGQVASGSLPARVSATEVARVGSVTWPIPVGASGFHLLVAALHRPDGSLVSTNDLPFDVVGSPDERGSLPGILWVETPSADGNALSGVDVSVDGYVKRTDALGKVAYVLPPRTYAVERLSGDSPARATVEVLPGRETTVILK